MVGQSLRSLISSSLPNPLEDAFLVSSPSLICLLLPLFPVKRRGRGELVRVSGAGVRVEGETWNRQVTSLNLHPHPPPTSSQHLGPD